MSVILGALALMITVGCIWQYRKGDRDASCTKQLFAMDTVMQFTVYGDDALLKDAQDVIADIESKASVTNPDSELYGVSPCTSPCSAFWTLSLLSPCPAFWALS